MPFLGGRGQASRGYFGGGTTPDAPTSLSSTPGDQQLFIAFTPPVFTGGLTITNYEYAVSSNGGSTYGSWTALSPADATSPVTIPGLTNGTAYYIKLRAVNSLGAGTESSPVTANTSPFGAPIVVTSPGSDATTTPTAPTTSSPTSTQSFGTLVAVDYTTANPGSGTWTNPYPAGASTGTGTLNGSAGTTHFVWGTSSGSYPNEVAATSNAYVRTTWPRGTTVYYKSKIINTSCIATFNGTVNANGASSTVTFEYGTSSGTYPSSVSAGTVTALTATAVTANVSLAAGTYYFRTKAINAEGTPQYGIERSIAISAKSATAASEQSFTPPAVTTLYELVAAGGGGGSYSSGSGGGGAVSFYSSASAPASLTYAVGAGGVAQTVTNGGTSTISFPGVSMTATGGTSSFADPSNSYYDKGGSSGVASGGTSNYPTTAYTSGWGSNIGDSDYGNAGSAGIAGNGTGYRVFENQSTIYAMGGNGGPGITLNFTYGGGSLTFGTGGLGYGNYEGVPGNKDGSMTYSDYGQGAYYTDASGGVNGKGGLVRFRYYGP